MTSAEVWLAGFIEGILTNYCTEENIRDSAAGEGVDPDEAERALANFKRKLRRHSVQIPKERKTLL